MVFNKFCCLRNFETKGILDMKEPLKHLFKIGPFPYFSTHFIRLR